MTKQWQNYWPHSAKPALNWFKEHHEAASVLVTAEQMLQLEALIRKHLPSGIGGNCHVAGISQQGLIIAVPGPAYASKVRQLVPGLLNHLNQAGYNLTKITVRIVGNITMGMQPKPKRNVTPLNKESLSCFASLQNELPPGPLAQAVNNLLKRHGHSD